MNTFLLKGTRLKTVLQDNGYEVVGGVYHRGPFSTTALLCCSVGTDVLIIAPKSIHGIILEYKRRDLLVTPRTYIKTPLLQKYILLLGAGRGYNSVLYSILFVWSG